MVRVLVLLLLFSSSYRALAQSGMDNTKEHCLSEIKSYSDFWRKDSLADNGFRYFFFWNLQSQKCTLVGEKWSDWKKYFGKETKLSTGNNYVYHRYMILKGSDQYSDEYIVIKVDDTGTIVGFYYIELCG